MSSVTVPLSRRLRAIIYVHEYVPTAWSVHYVRALDSLQPIFQQAFNAASFFARCTPPADPSPYLRLSTVGKESSEAQWRSAMDRHTEADNGPPRLIIATAVPLLIRDPVIKLLGHFVHQRNVSSLAGRCGRGGVMTLGRDLCEVRSLYEALYPVDQRGASEVAVNRAGIGLEEVRELGGTV